VWSNFLAEKTSRAAAFRTDWSGSSRTSGAPAIIELQKSHFVDDEGPKHGQHSRTWQRMVNASYLA